MTASPLTLDDHLAKIYAADIRGGREASIASFKTALDQDVTLKTIAATRLVALKALIDARGEQACAYSTKYWTYLTEALA